MLTKSTVDIDRQTAVAVITSKVNYCSNEELAGMLEMLEESYFRNYKVHDKLPDDDGHSSRRVIRSIRDFN
jgi:hypothetical protein